MRALFFVAERQVGSVASRIQGITVEIGVEYLDTESFTLREF